MQKIARYSLQKLLDAKNHSFLIAEVARYKKSLATRCKKIRSLLVAEVARCKKSLVTRCKIRSLLVSKVARYKKSLVTHCSANFDRYLLCKLTKKKQIQLDLVVHDKI